MLLKRALITFIILGAVLLSYFLLGKHPIVFRTSEASHVQMNNDTTEFNPLNDWTPDERDWCVYLIIDEDDFGQLTPELEPFKVWKANSIYALQSIQSAWNFKPSGGDMATVTSTVVIVYDGKIVFESGAVLDKNLLGLQGKGFGWAEPIQMKQFAETLKEFKKVRLPVVFI